MVAKLCQDAQCSKASVPLKAMPKTSEGIQDETPWRHVVFTDYGVAIRMAHWLKLNHASSSPYTDYRFNYPLTRAKST